MPTISVRSIYDTKITIQRTFEKRAQRITFWVLRMTPLPRKHITEYRTKSHRGLRKEKKQKKLYSELLRRGPKEPQRAKKKKKKKLYSELLRREAKEPQRARNTPQNFCQGSDSFFVFRGSRKNSRKSAS